MRAAVIYKFTAGPLFVAVLVANVFLQRANHTLRARIDELEASNGPPAGSSIPVIGGKDLTATE